MALLKNIIFGFLVASSLADLIADWLFYVELKGSNLSISCLIFCILGTVAFLGELGFLWKQNFNPEVALFVLLFDMTSAIVVVADTLPLLVLSFIWAVRQSWSVTHVQFVKMLAALIDTLIRLLVTVYTIKQLLGTPRGDRSRTWRVRSAFTGTVLVGCAAELCATAVFMGKIEPLGELSFNSTERVNSNSTWTG